MSIRLQASCLLDRVAALGLLVTYDHVYSGMSVKCEKNIWTGAASAEGGPLLHQANTQLKPKMCHFQTAQGGRPQIPGPILEDLHPHRKSAWHSEVHERVESR